MVSAPRLQRVNFRDVQDWVNCKHISGLSLGALVSRALMGSAHTRLIKLTVSKTKAQYKLLACRSDLSCYHFYFTPRKRWWLLLPKKFFVSRRASHGRKLAYSHGKPVRLQDCACCRMLLGAVGSPT